MNENLIDYDKIVEDALRVVVKKSLEIINENGIPGDHHFFISFDSTYKGIKVPNELKSSEDNEIKIILQHQFWNLKIDDIKFSVTLSFNGQKKDIIVPFNSIVSFSDPSVGFSLQFKKNSVKEGSFKERINQPEDSIKNTKQKNKAEVLSLDAFRPKKKD
ncbi:MAG: hypothetical protein CMN44_09345 [SAR116 cluster bacterium]|nr:hypothetical protein [SAR116 cluster bacterium]RPH08395.1 MAG: hypothetical protein CBC14_009220 [Alphaproteobacteria bacterium TMED54]|tara:strand:- start:1257 stop:1736 length:480 start_codon:yes stop_codon:yes gene_type:complete